MQSLPGGLLTTQHVDDPVILSPHYRRNIITRQYLYDQTDSLALLNDTHRETKANRHPSGFS